MASIYDILQEMKNTKSTKDKENILRQNQHNGLLKNIFHAVYNKQINFGVRNLPPETWSSNVKEAGLVCDNDQLLETTLDYLLNHLATRNVTGNDAIKYVTDLKYVLTEQNMDVVRRILLRNLECGVGETLPNKVWKDLIPAHKHMLCQPCNEKFLSRIKYPAISQVKEDGARAFAEIEIYKDGSRSVEFLTRNNNTYETLPHLVSYVGTLLDEWLLVEDNIIKNISIEEYVSRGFPILKGYVGKLSIDGELLVMNEEYTKILPREIGNGILNKALKGTASEDECSRIVYKIWDIYFEDDQRPYVDRLKLIEELIKFGTVMDETIAEDYPSRETPISLVGTIFVNSEAEAREHSLKCIEAGKEGTILKNTTTVWKDGRSSDQVKFKEVIYLDMEVVDFVENKSEDFKDTLGSLVLASKCGRIKVNCGTGFTNTQSIKQKDGSWVSVPLEERPESDREWIWAHREELKGRIVEVKCNALTTSEMREKGDFSLFLPVFCSFRNDKDEANTMDEIFDEIFKDGKVTYRPKKVEV